MPYVDIDGVNVHYTERRGGPSSVIFLHGGFGSSSDLWRETMEALPDEYSAYAIDNFLKSDPPPGGYNVVALARRTAGFAARLKLDRPVLVGHSMGGVVSQITAIRHPHAVGGLVLVCTGASMSNHQLARDLLVELRDGGANPKTLRSISAHWFHTAPRAFFDRYVALATGAPLEAMIKVQESLIDTDLRAELPKIRAPALVVFGAHDTGRTFEHAQTLLNGIRNSELATMHESGHTPMAETPDAFNAAFHGFLRRVSAAAYS
jgi:3-oxoadipate enol-lactonase